MSVFPKARCKLTGEGRGQESDGLTSGRALSPWALLCQAAGGTQSQAQDRTAQPQLSLKAKDSAVTTSLSSQGDFWAVPKGLIKSWGCWSSGDAEARPAQPVGISCAEHRASTDTSCGIWGDGWSSAAASSSPERCQTVACPGRIASPGEVWISPPAFPHARSASLKPPWSSHLLTTQLVMVCVMQGAVQHSNHIPSLGCLRVFALSLPLPLIQP